ncbi:MAG: hypothetical protein VX570_07430, partial [Pseudomonadota bacterium]|nr:hypothetical protein [Pseudomonadota bacterium]
PPPPPPPPPRAASSKPAPPPPPPKPEPAAPAKVEAAEILPDKPKPKPKVDLPKPKPKKTEVAQVSPKPKPKPKAETKPKAKPSPSVLPTPKPARRPERKPAAPTAKPAKANDAVANKLNKLVKDQKKREQAASGVLQNLAEAQLAAKDAEKARKTQERKVAADTVTKTLSAVAGNAVKAPEKKSLSPVGIDDIARIQQHVSKCWQPPLGAAGNDTLKVDIFVAVNELGEVRRAEIEDKLRFNLDSYFKASAIAARRAIVECSPLPIPPEKFDQLKEFTFSFDPAFLSR